MISWRFVPDRRVVVAAGAGMAIVLVAVLVLPGRTFTGRYAADIMTFLDGADRVLAGQIPNRDFPNAIGPLSTLLPAFGLWFSGSLGGMFPWATAACCALLLPPLLYVSARLPWPWALGFMAWALILTVAPLNPGEHVEWVSFAMFYNRWCWAALGILIVMAATDRPRPVADALAIAFLLLFLFYLKMSYALVGFAFTAGMLLIGDMRRAAALGLALAVAAIVIIQLAWGGNYFADLATAADANGPIRGGLLTLARIVLQNLLACSLFAGIVVVAFVRGARLKLLLSVAVAAAGVLLINHNAQELEILSLVPAAIVALGAREKRLAPNLMLAALALPFIATGSVALAFHAARASRPPADARAELDRMIVDERVSPWDLASIDDLQRAYHAGRGDTRLINALAAQGAPQAERLYLRSIEDGVDAVRDLPGSIAVFDMSNPFNALLDRPPPRGRSIWMVVGRNLTRAHHPPAERTLADIVMLPKSPHLVETERAMLDIYGPDLRRDYKVAKDTDFWIVLTRK